jgi:nucleotide-binding universal stress UspA family protein
MYKHILIAVDGSDLAASALSQGLGLAKALAARLTIVTVTEPWATQMTGEAAAMFPFTEYDKAMAANAAEILSKANMAASQAGIACSTVHVRERHPAEGILETAKAGTCDLIVMASHGRRGLSRLFLGSQAQNVVTHSTIPVLICR